MAECNKIWTWDLIDTYNGRTNCVPIPVLLNYEKVT